MRSKALKAKLEGKKTYLIAVIGVALNFAVYMNWITVDQLGVINSVLAGLGLAALRAGVSKTN